MPPTTRSSAGPAGASSRGAAARRCSSSSCSGSRSMPRSSARWPPRARPSSRRARPTTSGHVSKVPGRPAAGAEVRRSGRSSAAATPGRWPSSSGRTISSSAQRSACRRACRTRTASAAARASGYDVRLGEIVDADEGDITPVRDPRARRSTSQIGTLVVQVVGDRTAEARTLDVLLLVLLVGGAIVVVAAIGFGALYARRALVPIRESLDSQRTALRRQREFAADASHELRTPLTVIRGSVDYLRRHGDQPVGVGRGRARRHLGRDRPADDARRGPASAGPLRFRRRDPGAAAGRPRRRRRRCVVVALDPGVIARRVPDRVDPAPATVPAMPLACASSSTILVDNAIRHSPTGGAVTVGVRSDGPERCPPSSRTTGRASGRRTCRGSSTGSTGPRAHRTAAPASASPSPAGSSSSTTAGSRPRTGTPAGRFRGIDPARVRASGGAPSGVAPRI